MPIGKIKVLIVDDSAFIRKALTRMLSSDPSIEVIGHAIDGFEAVRKVASLRPDVITLDIRMPGMDGLTALNQIMNTNPTPVIVISSVTTEGGETTLKALSQGAVDFIDKSSCHTVMDILDIAGPLVEKVKIAAGVDIKKLLPIPRNKKHQQKTKLETSPIGDSVQYLVAIGASTGGPPVLEKLLKQVPVEFPGAFLIVQHMPVGFTASLAERLNDICKITVTEAKDEGKIEKSHAYIAPGGYHLTLKKARAGYTIHLDKNPTDVLHRPSVDIMMQSTAQYWDKSLLGVLLTGMGDDGALGMCSIKQRGGLTIAQDEASCVVFGMPKAAQKTGCVDLLLPPDEIIHEIIKFAW